MPNTYNGDATGITQATPVTLTVPADGDDLNVASILPNLIEVLANIQQYLQSNTAKRGSGSNVNSLGIYFSMTGHKLARLVQPTDLGAAGADQYRAPLDVIEDAAGNVVAQTYVAAAGDFEVARNCVWNTLLNQWSREQAGTAAVFRFTVSGTTVFLKSTGAANDTWDDALVGVNPHWDKSAQLDLSTAFAQGDVFGATGASTVGLGRPCEAKTAFPFGGAGWADAYGAAHYWKDGSGKIHIEGAIQAQPGVASGVIGTLPAGYRPSQIRNLPVLADIAGVDKIGWLGITTAGVCTLNTTGGYGGGGLDAITAGDQWWIDGISFT